mmetsp:Transcript_115958/g.360246  ORF Transcript_115958/g.360246 Transcript_115958/m.360246 type:complete len:354 (-) Transcript_115958:14-1075(-)
MAATKVKVKKSVAELVRWLNTEGGLGAEVRLAAVAKPLAALDEATALEVLNGLVEQEEAIDDPTTWVCEAAKAIQEAGGGAAEAEEEPQQAAAAPKAAPKVKLPAAVVGKVRELNESGALQAKLPIGEVAEALAMVSREAQDGILRSLEAAAGEVSNPVGWVRNACHKRAGKGKGKGQGPGKGKGKAQGKAQGKGKPAALLGLQAPEKKPLTASERKILRTINFINGTLGLEKPINYRSVKESLDLVDEKTQLRILNVFREKVEGGQEISNPTTWIKNGCVRSNERYQTLVKERNEKKRQGAQEWEEEAPAKRKKAAAAAAEEAEAWPEEAAEAEEEWPEDAEAEAAAEEGEE